MMRSIKKTLYVSMLLVFCLQGKSMQESFLQANRAYKEGDCQKALSLYETITPKGSATWSNMGHCQYQLGELTKALACWKRAERGASLAELRAITRNTLTVRAQLSADKKAQGSLSWYQLVRLYALAMPLLLVQLLLLISIYILFLLLLFFKNARWARILSIFLGLKIFLLGSLIAIRYTQEKRVLAIVHDKEVTLYVGPDERLHMVGVVHQGDEVIRGEEQNGWCCIKAGSTVGWVPRTAVVGV